MSIDDLAKSARETVEAIVEEYKKSEKLPYAEGESRRRRIEKKLKAATETLSHFTMPPLIVRFTKAETDENTFVIVGLRDEFTDINLMQFIDENEDFGGDDWLTELKAYVGFVLDEQDLPVREIMEDD